MFNPRGHISPYNPQNGMVHPYYQHRPLAYGGLPTNQPPGHVYNPGIVGVATRRHSDGSPSTGDYYGIPNGFENGQEIGATLVDTQHLADTQISSSTMLESVEHLNLGPGPVMEDWRLSFLSEQVATLQKRMDAIGRQHDDVTAAHERELKAQRNHFQTLLENLHKISLQQKKELDYLSSFLKELKEAQTQQLVLITQQAKSLEAVERHGSQPRADSYAPLLPAKRRRQNPA
ncbi:hypothetical protein DL546_008011 [Coniochaeta pulveracea]|uniref:Uncharacterized protein n=1 Tax=Coniochaeta pulveracea TaxID=177199 RepID=A0A420YIX8_9PEZI|nr:hypothetical protein DL546_008011 [Coniochaeta pulveracea]